MTKIKEVIKIKNKNKIINSVIFLLLLICGFSLGMLFSSPLVIHVTEFINPKLSAGEITIITPENKTYTNPDSGCYPATYGFENDNDGTIPEGWTDESPYSSCSISVYDQKDAHNKVVQIYDANTGTGADATAQHNFESLQVTGTIECWIYKDSGDCALVIQGDSEGPTGFAIQIDAYNNGIFRYSTAPGTFEEFANGKYMDQNWFHMRIDFDCNTDTTDIYVNGKIEVDDGQFRSPVSNISKIILRSGYNGRSGVMYFDALGYSWDPNYNVGDNLNEGLLLSYDNTTTLDWQGYSLDGAANKTIIGNTTIPMPADGHHTIQVFGNDSLGAIFESDLRHFSVFTGPPDITINSPTDSQVIGSTAPSYDISITGVYDSIWYALEGSTNYTATGLTGTIDQSAWSALSDGIITIDFYANNSAWMEGTAQVQVIKDSSEEPSPPPTIPGYDLYLLLGALSVLSAILIRKRLKS